MLDILQALVLGASLTIDIYVMTMLPEISARTRRWAVAGLVGWTVTIVGAAASGRLGQPPIVFAGTVIAVLATWSVSPAFRRALTSIPMRALIGIHILRLLAIFFIISFALHRLPWPFAPIAGWGDIISALGAISLSVQYARNGQVNRTQLAVWNTFGALDLFTALTLGALSADGLPIRFFTDAPGMALMGQLPNVLIPTVLVPLYLVSHFTIAARLRETRTSQKLAGNAYA